MNADERATDYRGISRDSREVIARLDGMDYPDLLEELGEPQVTTVYYESPWWHPGDSRPALATDDVATVQAMARCAASRVRGPVVLPDIHPLTCGWCIYPEAELRAAVGHGAWRSRYIAIERASWKGYAGSHYDTATPRDGTYENPAWALFSADDPDRVTANRRRRQDIEAATGAGDL